MCHIILYSRISLQYENNTLFTIKSVEISISIVENQDFFSIVSTLEKNLR